MGRKPASTASSETNRPGNPQYFSILVNKPARWHGQWPQLPAFSSVSKLPYSEHPQNIIIRRLHALDEHWLDQHRLDVIDIRAITQFHDGISLWVARQVALVFGVHHTLLGLAQVWQDHVAVFGFLGLEGEQIGAG